MNRSAAKWLRQGISPGRLAFTLALGIAVGCFPIVGIPTVLCAFIALALRLNLPAIQAANYAVMPLQMLLIVPFVRLGGWMLADSPINAAQARSLLHASPLHLALQVSSLAVHAMLAWLVIAVPAVALMSFVLTLLLRRTPALTAFATGN